MAADSDCPGGLSSKRFAVGLSTIIGLTGIPGQCGLYVRLTNASGSTLEIGGASLTWGQGFQMPDSSNVTTSQVFFPVKGTVYFVATGATANVTVTRLVTNPDLAG